MNSRRPEQRANERQRGEHSAELHKALGIVMAHWPNIAEEADARPWATRNREPGSPGGHSDPTGTIALVPDAFGDWLIELIELGAMLRRMAARAEILDPPRASNVGRENSVDMCERCNEPIGGKCHRIDGKPYHADTTGDRSENCYYRTWRDRRANAANG